MDYSINTTQRPEDGIEETESDSDQQISATRPLFKETAPNDKFYVCYIVFYVFGITSLLPWNFFITADSVSGSKLVMFVTLIAFFSVLDVQVAGHKKSYDKQDGFAERIHVIR